MYVYNILYNVISHTCPNNANPIDGFKMSLKSSCVETPSLMQIYITWNNENIIGQINITVKGIPA